MRRGWRTINATSANPPMHELSWSFLLFFCQKLTQDSNNNIRFSPPCDVLAHIRPWKIKLEPSAPSQTHLNWKKGREKLEATRPKNKRNYLIFSHFPPKFRGFGVHCPVAGSDERSPRSESDFSRGHLNFSTPNTKRRGRHKTEFLFKSLPAAVCSHVVFTWHRLQPVLNALNTWWRPTCWSLRKENNKRKLFLPTTSTKSLHHVNNPSNVPRCESAGLRQSA